MSQFQSSDVIALEVEQERSMARSLAQQRSELPPGIRVLAICGGLHARTQKCAIDPANKPVTLVEQNNARPDMRPTGNVGKFALPWPACALSLKEDHPQWRIQSVEVEAFSGDYFAVVSVVGQSGFSPGVHKIRSKKKIDHAELHSLKNDSWDWELDLPKSTAATFLAPPSLDVWPGQAEKKVGAATPAVRTGGGALK